MGRAFLRLRGAGKERPAQPVRPGRAKGGAKKTEWKAAGVRNVRNVRPRCGMLILGKPGKGPAGKGERRGMAGRKKAENKKTMREILDAFLRMPAPESALEEKALLLAQARGAPLDLYEAVVLTQIAKAMKGDTSAAAFVRDSAGDKPTEKGAAAAAPALSENDLALLRKLDAAGALETLAGTKQSAAGGRRARAPGGRAAQSGGAGAQPKAAGAAAQAEIFLPEKSPNG